MAVVWLVSALMNTAQQDGGRRAGRTLFLGFDAVAFFRNACEAA